VQIPDVVGMTLTAAESAIQQAFVATGDSGSGPPVSSTPSMCDDGCPVPLGQWIVTFCARSGDPDWKSNGSFGWVDLVISPPESS
jgi:hypothetical protein